MSRTDIITSQATETPNRWIGEVVVDTGLGALQSGLPGFGAIGYVAGVPISLIVADREADKKLEEITARFRGELATHFGVPEKVVTPQMMMMAANEHEGIAKAIQSVWAAKDAHMWVNGAGIAGLAAGAGTAAALAGGPVSWLALGAASIVGSLAGEGIGRQLFGADENLNPMTHLNAIEAKRGKVSTDRLSLEVFRLRVALNEGLREHIADAHGTEFFKMDEEGQLRAMNGLPSFKKQSLEDAEFCQHPQANVNALMFGSPKAEPVVKEFAEAGLVEAKRFEPESVPPAESGPVHGHWTARAIAEGKGPGNGGRSFTDRVTTNPPSVSQPGF